MGAPRIACGAMLCSKHAPHHLAGLYGGPAGAWLIQGFPVLQAICCGFLDGEPLCWRRGAGSSDPDRPPA